MDVISPCVTFNDHKGSTKSYAHTRFHMHEVVETDFVPLRREITTDYDEGDVQSVKMHDGSTVRFRKVAPDYDPTDRGGVLEYLRASREKGEVATGLLYMEENGSDMHAVENTVDVPLVDLPYEKLCPGKCEARGAAEGVVVDGRPDARPSGGAAPDDLRNVLAQWASTVTVVAVRDDDRVHAVTVTSFFPVSLEPPLVAVSLGANAQPLPWLDPGATFVVNLLAEGQRRIASAYTDSLPQIASPFPTSGDPMLEGALASLACTVETVHAPGGGTRLVLGRVERIHRGGGERPLLYWRRGYRGLAGDE